MATVTKMKLNWNTILIVLIFPILLGGGHELWSELKTLHDAVTVIKIQMISRSEYDLAMSEIKTRLLALEWEIQKSKDKKP